MCINDVPIWTIIKINVYTCGFLSKRPDAKNMYKTQMQQNQVSIEKPNAVLHWMSSKLVTELFEFWTIEIILPEIIIKGAEAKVPKTKAAEIKSFSTAVYFVM